MLNKILVPLDGSALAETSLPYARQIAAQTASQIVLLHVSSTAEDSADRMRHLYLEKLVDSLALPGGAQTLTVHLTGHAAEKIIEYSDAAGIDLIVMTTHGESGARRWALGSVADKVVRASKHPVFLVRSGKSATTSTAPQLKKIFIPLDGSQAAESIIPFVEALVPSVASEVILFQALGTGFPSVVALGYEHSQHGKQPVPEIEKEKADAEAYLKQTANRLKARGVKAETSVAIGDAADLILSQVSKVSADFVAMATHGRSGPARWVLGSVADKVLHEGTTPLLLVRSAGARVE